MNKEKMLDLLLKDLKKMTDSEVVRNYKASGISVINYNKDKVGNVDLYDYDEGVIYGNIKSTEVMGIRKLEKFHCFEIGKDVA